MSVTPRDLLAWANGTAANQEVEDRATISRAYYAAYHRCREWYDQRLAGRGKPGHSPPHRTGSHEELIHRLANPHLTCTTTEHATSTSLAGSLTALKALRHLADYKIYRSVGSALAAQACADAAQIFLDAV